VKEEDEAMNYWVVKIDSSSLQENKSKISLMNHKNEEKVMLHENWKVTKRF
jgi:hypothetical protein